MADQEENDAFLKELEGVMRAEFFPDSDVQPNLNLDGLSQQMRETQERLASMYPHLFGGPPPGDMSDLTRQLEEQWSLTGMPYTMSQGDALRPLLQRLQGLPLDGDAREQVDSIAHSARQIESSSNYINRSLGSMIPMLKSMTELLFSPEADTLADPSLSYTDRVSRGIAFIEKMRNMPGLNEGIEELSQVVPGIRSVVNDQLDSFLSRMRDFQAAAERPMLPDLSASAEFQYQSLTKRTSIRVLRFDASGDSTADSNPNLIKLRAEEVDLDDNPEFNALSYVWGDHRPPLGQDHSANRAKLAFPILCNDQKILVTYNLFCFLRRLSTATDGPLHEIRGMPLWIDQLCINQADNAEKAVQVGMMDRVYAQASKVVSWLGESDSHVDGAVGLLGRLKDVSLARVTQPDFDVAKFVKDISNDDWLSLGALLARPYFKRAWIVQEIAMAKQLLMVCGKHTLLWDDLVHCSAILEKSKAWAMLSRYASVFRGAQDHISPDGHRRHSVHYGGQLAALLEAQNTIRNPCVAPENLLLLGKQFDATVPVDKYFAMLGLHRHRIDAAVPESDLLTVDYSRSLKQVAMDFAKYHIQASGSLRILSLLEDPSHRSPASAEFPSWLPDPTAPFLPLPLDTNPWGTVQAHLPAKPPTVDGDSLLIQGKRLSTITHTATPFSTLQQTQEWHHLFNFLATLPQPPQPPTLSRAAALYHTLTTTPLPTTSPKSPDTTPPTLATDFPAWCISLASTASNPNQTSLADTIIAETLQQSYRLDDTQFDALAFGKDAGSIFQPEVTPTGGNSNSSNPVIDQVVRRSEIRYTYMDRRERDKVDYGALGRKVEEALRRAWEVCEKDREQSGREGENGFPDPSQVRRGLEALDHFADDRADERREVQHRVDRFAAAVGMRLDSRRLFFTDDGRLGMGHESVCERDEVWEVDGLLAPVVLRRMEPGAFRFLGEAFVLGLMGGVDTARTDGSQLVDVVLK